ARFAIEGMSCGGCVRGVTAALQRLPGVDVREVSIGSAQVSFDPSKISPAAIAEALIEAGYPARQDSNPDPA
ncbi:MAG: heavy-metal-associated domain-containing protein, partial [Thermoguttaceae bacterium]